MGQPVSPRKPLPTAVRWRAPKPDGIGHLYPRKGPALCGAPNQEERFDHSRKTRCSTCVTSLQAAAAR